MQKMVQRHVWIRVSCVCANHCTDYTGKMTQHPGQWINRSTWHTSEARKIGTQIFSILRQRLMIPYIFFCIKKLPRNPSVWPYSNYSMGTGSFQDSLPRTFGNNNHLPATPSCKPRGNRLVRSSTICWKSTMWVSPWLQSIYNAFFFTVFVSKSTFLAFFNVFGLCIEGLRT